MTTNSEAYYKNLEKMAEGNPALTIWLAGMHWRKRAKITDNSFMGEHQRPVSDLWTWNEDVNSDPDEQYVSETQEAFDALATEGENQNG